MILAHPARPHRLPSDRFAPGGADERVGAACWAGVIVPVMALAWPLRVGSHEVVPVEVEAGTDKFHLVQRRPGEETPGAGGHEPDDRSPMTPDPWLKGDHDRVWEPRTLCGRPAGLVSDGDGLDLLGADQRRLCQSCWRAVEGWLRAPGPARGESEAIAWAVATVLEIGEAMIDGVPISPFRVDPPRDPVRAQSCRRRLGAHRQDRAGIAVGVVGSRQRRPNPRGQGRGDACRRRTHVDARPRGTRSAGPLASRLVRDHLRMTTVTKASGWGPQPPGADSRRCLVRDGTTWRSTLRTVTGSRGRPCPRDVRGMSARG